MRYFANRSIALVALCGALVAAAVGTYTSPYLHQVLWDGHSDRAGRRGIARLVDLKNQVARYPFEKAAIAERVVKSLEDTQVSQKIDQARFAGAKACAAVATEGGLLLGRFGDGDALTLASVTKLFTAAAALELLGPEFRFETRLVVVTETSVSGSAPTLAGQAKAAYLVGGGDPFLASSAFIRWSEKIGARWPITRADDLALAVASAGWKTISTLYVDSSLYDSVHFPPKMPEFLRQQKLLPPVSAASIDRNIASLKGDGPVEFSGDPPLQMAERVAEALRSAGVTVRVVKSATLPSELADLPDADPRVFTVRSEPLQDWLPQLLQRSDNFVAEMLAKRVASSARGVGTWDGFARTVRELLLSWGIGLPSLELADGSGLSENRASCLDLAKFAAQARGRPALRPLWDSLAGPKVRGSTLERRYTDLPGGVLLRAKTGSLARTSSLCGAIYAPDGVGVVFSVLVEAEDASERRDLVEAPVVEAVAAGVASAAPSRG
jgi:serine-type D-Ala-D-Ala carboxypeptidase/endopeptidase (penicillin-binding protein 4)